MLISKDNSEIIKYLKDIENQGKNLKAELMKMCWYMRGGLTWQESLNLSPDERKIISDLVKDNLETTKKTGRDFF